MKKARTLQGGLILASRYNPDVHGAELSCADPACNARMHFRHGGAVAGNSYSREDHFYSLKAAGHSPDCTGYYDAARQAKTAHSLKSCLKQGGRVLLNLNMDLDRHKSARPAFSAGNKSAADIAYGATAGMRSADQLLDTVAALGATVLDRVFVNYQGHTQAYRDFVIDSPAQYKQLVKRLYQLPVDGKAEGLPHLITFRATRNTRGSQDNNFRGSPVTLTVREGAALILLQQATGAADYADTLRGETVALVARPRLDRKRTAKVFFNFNAGHEGEHFVSLLWQVNSAAQFTPLSAEAPAPAKTFSDKPVQMRLL